MNKRGLSPVIATVMIILITIVAAGIIASFTIPFVQNSLGEGKECFDVLGEINFAESSYNCYYESSLNNSQSTSAFSVKIDGERISGFSFVLGNDGTSDSFKVTENSTNQLIGMLNGNYNQVLSVPKDGGVRTYIVKGVYTTAELYPVLPSGKVCDAADSVTISPCSDSQTISQLSSYGP